MKSINENQNGYGLFSIYNFPITNTKPQADPVSVKEIFQLITSEKLIAQTEMIANCKSKAEQTRLKKTTLPSITFSGIFKRRKDDQLVKYSKLICIDLDDLKELVQTKQKILEALHPILIFVSPSRTGLKIVFVINSDERQHKDYFHAIKSMFSKELGLRIDKGAEISKACFLCHDQDAFYSEDYVVLDQAFLDTFLELSENYNIHASDCSVNIDDNPSTDVNEVVVFQQGLAWVDKDFKFIKNQRHRYVTELAAFLNRTGQVSEEFALNKLLEFSEPDFDVKEITGIVKGIYKKKERNGIAPVRRNKYADQYAHFPLKMLHGTKKTFCERIKFISEGDFDKGTHEVPTSIKKSYLKDAGDGRLEPELLLLLASIKSILSRREWWKSNKQKITDRMFGEYYWHKASRTWFKHLCDRAMMNNMLTILADPYGRRCYYISICLKPGQLAEVIIQENQKKEDKKNEIEKAKESIKPTPPIEPRKIFLNKGNINDSLNNDNSISQAM